MQKDSAELAEKFPYIAYLESGVIFRPAQLHNDKLWLAKKGLDAERIIYTLCKTYMEQYPPDVNNIADLQRKLRMAEAFSLKHKLFPESKAYYAAKDLLFGAVSECTESAINKGEISSYDPSIQYLVIRLQENHYFLNLPKSSWSKLLFHIQKGNWLYIWDRFSKRYTDYWAEISFTIVILLLPFLFLQRKKRRTHVKKNK